MNTKEFSLRPLEPRDSARMLEWMLDPNITQYLQIGGPDTTLEMVETFLKNCVDETKNLHRAVVGPEDEYLGTVSLKNIDHKKKEAEYAISMHGSSLGTGAASAASKLIVDLAFSTLGLERVYLNVLEENQRAVNFYNKFGFQYTHESIFHFRGSDKKMLWYEIRK